MAGQTHVMASPLDVSQKVLKFICSCQLSAVLTGPAIPARL